MSGIHLPLQKPTGTMITDANGVDVANILTGTRRTIAEHEELANLIVRAVNNHDELLAAAKAFVQWADECWGSWAINSEDTPKAKAQYEAAKAAIAAAEKDVTP